MYTWAPAEYTRNDLCTCSALDHLHLHRAPKQRLAKALTLAPHPPCRPAPSGLPTLYDWSASASIMGGYEPYARKKKTDETSISVPGFVTTIQKLGEILGYLYISRVLAKTRRTPILVVVRTI
eukprot:SAG22_NODE_123_length_18914_cov_28.993410_8_plen_123_part_00